MPNEFAGIAHKTGFSNGQGCANFRRHLRECAHQLFLRRLRLGGIEGAETSLMDGLCESAQTKLNEAHRLPRTPALPCAIEKMIAFVNAKDRRGQRNIRLRAPYPNHKQFIV